MADPPPRTADSPLDAEANAAARRCVESGRSVSVQRAIPPRLRYRELLDLRGKGEPTC